MMPPLVERSPARARPFESQERCHLIPSHLSWTWQYGRELCVEEDTGPRTPQDAEAPASLFLSLLQAMQRPGRGPAFPFQPQRFGRNTQGSRSNERLSTRAEEGLSSPFWSLAAPQRFGKK
ncbi:pro-FMRFamide-related neuropeptide FF isoform X2 [Eptesicus fuscus]|uniref:pro-FMRFamide-related neuropeptide FF isoform X2 n=1 Tax=Eptesicus fuscus TaxID=29078 RepID=UPI0024048916|nr:pro-FMRFamide-related neuropeptide FF isoform X2 [Eptesicus fuscus]